MKMQIDYELFLEMRDLCLDIIEQAELINDIDKDGDYRIEPYGGGIVFISKEAMETLQQLKNM